MTNRMLLSICAVLAMGATCRKKNPETETKPEQKIEVSKPDVDLQVLSMNPDEIEVGDTQLASVAGSGFVDGLTAKLGDVSLSGVTFGSSEQFSFEIPALQEGSYDLRVENPNGTAHTLRSALLVTLAKPTVPEECATISVLFGKNQFGLTDDIKRELEEKANCFTGDFNYRVEGHCDERGTTEYNMALGVRRAQAIHDYISSLGISTEKIETISYGEERPIATGSGETIWKQNRRAVIAVFE